MVAPRLVPCGAAAAEQVPARKAQHRRLKVLETDHADQVVL